MNFLPFSPLISFVPVVVIGLWLWFAWDMRSIIVSLQQKNRLAIEGRWKDLENYYERAEKPCRPFVWLHRNYLLPGNTVVQHALFLYKHGRPEEALVKVDRAIQLIERKPRIFRSIHQRGTSTTLRGAFRARILILGGLGRYDEARQTAARLQQLDRTAGPPNPALALLEYQCGNLDEALAHAKAVAPEDKEFEPKRAVVASAYSLKGEFQEALQALMYEPSDISKFYRPEGLQQVSGTPEGAKLIELQRRKYAGVFQPGRLLLIAHVHLAYEDVEPAVQALNEAEKSLGSEPAIQMAYWRDRACSLAMLGNAGEAEMYIERMRAMARQMSRILHWEAHFSTARSYFYIGRFNEALAELNEAQKYVLHPVEKHHTSYWLARIHEAAGHRREAREYYQAVAADPISSWMRKQSVEALARQ